MSLTDVHVYVYVIPLVIAISLVYSASRFESWSKILKNALRLCGMMFGVLLVATTILLLINSQI
jgi:threonine/homoserine/homoserine lactone efflux protein